MKLVDLLESQRTLHGPRRLRRSVGDGYLFAHNPYFRRVREAALGRGFQFTTCDTEGYFGFPLLGLDVILTTRKIPYRDNVRALEALERARPGFFRLSDLHQNRPRPNYVLHEAAHAVAFHEVFGRPASVAETLAEPTHLLGILTGEAFAMTAEYLAACCVSGALHRWLFSVNSYRHRTQAKRALGNLMLELGQPPVIAALLGGFVVSNHLRESITLKDLEVLFDRMPGLEKPRFGQCKRLKGAVSRAMKMSREFRVDTARLFLCKFGHARRFERGLTKHPLRSAAANDDYFSALARLMDVLVHDPRQRGS